MIPFFRRNGRLVLVGIAVSLFCLALSELFAAQAAVPTGSWGLSFRAEGQPPVGNATAQALRQYDAAYIGDGREKVIYLTFDAGYENGNTAKILDVLKARGVPAAFFVVGNYLQTSPELVRRMADEGHLVGNHTEHHWDMSRIADEETFRQELASVEARYREITGREMEKYYRPPQGVYSEENLKCSGASPTWTGIRTTSRPPSRPFQSSFRASIRVRSCCCTARQGRTPIFSTSCSANGKRWAIASAG